MSETKSNSISTAYSAGGIKENYLNHFLQASDRLGQVIQESSGHPDYRIRMLTLHLIHFHPDDTSRKRMHDYFKLRIKQISEKHKDVVERNIEISEFCSGEMYGTIVAAMDELLGISHKQQIGVL